MYYNNNILFSASVKLPVMLFGPDPLVEAFMDLIANNLGTVFTVEKPGNPVLLTLILPLFLS